MRYPKLLQKGDTIGICAPSSGASGDILFKRLGNAIKIAAYTSPYHRYLRRLGKCD